MYEVSAQVLSVSGKNTSKGTVYEVAMSDGVKYQTWDAGIAQKAQGLQGQVVAARVEQKINGKWTNYYLEDIGLPGTLPPLAQPLAATPAPVVAGPGGNVGPAPVVPIPMQAPVDHEAKDNRIVRENVIRTAFTFVASLYTGAGPEALDEAEREALKLAATLYGKVYGTGGAQPAPEIPTTPAEVAAVVPGVEVGTANVEQPVAAPTPEF